MSQYYKRDSLLELTPERLRTARSWWKWPARFWSEIRRPKCRVCRGTVPKGHYLCDKEECQEIHHMSRMAP